MARQIFIVNATQVVISESHPEGFYSVYQGYPKTFDTLDNENDVELARIVANAEYAERVKLFAQSKNRAKWTVTLSNADGDVLEKRTYGAFPVTEPEEPIEE